MSVFEVAMVAPDDRRIFRLSLPRRPAGFFLVAEWPFSARFAGMMLCRPVSTSQAAPLTRRALA